MPAPSPAAAAALAGLGLFVTAPAYLPHVWPLASAGPVDLPPVALLIPASAVLLGAAAPGGAPEPRHARLAWQPSPAASR